MMNANNFSDFGLHGSNISFRIFVLTFVGVFWAKINPILLIIASGLVGYFVY
jgi:hypothetical protein